MQSAVGSAAPALVSSSLPDIIALGPLVLVCILQIYTYLRHSILASLERNEDGVDFEDGVRCSRDILRLAVTVYISRKTKE